MRRLPFVTGRSLGSRAMEGSLRCISSNDKVTLLLLHALYDLFTSIQHQFGLARCLTASSTVSTLQDCNFTSLSLKTSCSGAKVPAARSQRPPCSHLDSASLHPGSILCWQCTRGWRLSCQLLRNMRKMMGEKGWSGTDEIGTSVWLELSDCSSHCRDVLDLEHHHSQGPWIARLRGR